ncbi:MAG: ASKHA domain-containing protein [Anaerolineae bacterium]|nr:ASKHA domain-containing protein [Anaerolineae bacterium]MDW8099400.1 ASKHA domain-containing protein [Anaerolineae bacterium]
MTLHSVRFLPADAIVQVPTGTLVIEAARQAGLDLNIPCGGQGRCGRCAVLVRDGMAAVRRRVTLRLSPNDLAAGYALACQSVIEGDTTIEIPPQERIVRRLTTEKAARRVVVPFPYHWREHQTIHRYFVQLPLPTLDDQTDDWARLRRELARQYGLRGLVAELPTLQRLGTTLRAANWAVTAVVELDTWDRPNGPPRLVDLLPGDQSGESWGLAIDIGTTTVTVYLVDLLSGQVVAQAAEYNGQIARGEDIISRIIYASKGNGLAELRQMALDTINPLIATVAQYRRIRPEHIHKATVAGNTTMMHLFLGVPPEPIRLTPYIPIVNDWPTLCAAEVGLNICPTGTVDCLPGVASYVGADITAGVLSISLDAQEGLTLFIDVGTNGETVLGTGDWMLTCACSAGPAFEGAGVEHGMRATEGAIEEVWISSQTYEPTYRVIGGGKPRGICGSGLISLLAELFITGVLDKGGNLRLDLGTPRVREGAHGPEYVVAWAEETAHGRDIVLTKVDIDNLIRAKAAIYAGFSVLCESVGVNLQDVDRMLIGGAFGQYINVEKAIQIGMLPDLPWDRFHFLGNTSVMGAYMALLRRDVRQRLVEIAHKLTYVELSADNRFYDQFTSALFLPHTDLMQFPSVAALMATPTQ